MRPTSSVRSAAAFAWPDPLRLVRRALANRRTVKALNALDDRQLADIGLSRLDVEWASGLPLSSDPASELERHVRRRHELRRLRQGEE
jgi:uncharacterized protein YjiS (DUF1127 family)